MLKRIISRRRFIKTGLAWMASTAASISFMPGMIKNKKILGVSRTSLKPLLSIPTTCEQCPAGCGIYAQLNGEKLVQIVGNPLHPINQGKICAKGVAGINLVNDPERLLSPMKRKGARGDNQWSRITWDEAYSTLGTRIERLLKNKNTEEFLVDIGQADPLLDRFISALGRPQVINRHALKNLNRKTAALSMTNQPVLVEDIGRSRTILNFGANPLAHHDRFIEMARQLIHAKTYQGARLFTFDVRMSETAAKSDIWYPIKAGTDAIVALAIANTIVNKGLADEDFIKHRSYYSFSQIKQHLATFTPEAAENESGIKAEDIERTAIEFASQRPSLAIIGGGILDHVNGTQNARCIHLLNWLAGNLDEDGGLLIPRYPKDYFQKTDLLKRSFTNTNQIIREKNPVNTPRSKIDTYFAYLSNPAFSGPDCTSTAEFLRDEVNVPFIVVMDTHLTETALMADLVLPAATYLESWGINIHSAQGRIPVVSLKQPTVALLSPAQALRSPDYDMGKLLEPTFKPRGESEEIGNVCLELARRIGRPVSESLQFRDTRDYCVRMADQVPRLDSRGGFEHLRQQGVWAGTESDKTSLFAGQKIGISPVKSKERNNNTLPEYQPSLR